LFNVRSGDKVVPLKYIKIKYLYKESKGVKVRKNVTRKGKTNVEMSQNISVKHTARVSLTFP
jgi:molybdenum cofactor biosynthesis enzyme